MFTDHVSIYFRPLHPVDSFNHMNQIYVLLFCSMKSAIRKTLCCTRVGVCMQKAQDVNVSCTSTDQKDPYEEGGEDSRWPHKRRWGKNTTRERKRESSKWCIAPFSWVMYRAMYGGVPVICCRRNGGWWDPVKGRALFNKNIDMQSLVRTMMSQHFICHSVLPSGAWAFILIWGRMWDVLWCHLRTGYSISVNQWSEICQKNNSNENDPSIAYTCQLLTWAHRNLWPIPDTFRLNR